MNNSRSKYFSAEYLGFKVNNWRVSRIFINDKNKSRWELTCKCGRTAEYCPSNFMHNPSNQCITCSNLRRFAAIFEKWNSGKEISTFYHTQVKSGAKKRGIKFELTPEYLAELWYKQEGRCAYTGMLLVIPNCRKQKGKDTSASLDRIDSDVGYIEGNVHWVHKNINKMKMNMPHETFLELCKLVTENRSHS